MEKMKLDIINTATTLFKKYGLRSISIDDVCKELRISKKTFYNYFKQKEELIEEVLQNIHEQSKKTTKLPWVYDEGKNIIDIVMDSEKDMMSSSEKGKKHFIMLYDLEKYYPNVFKKHMDIMSDNNQEVMKNFIKQGLLEKLFREDLNIDLMSKYITAQFQTMRGLIKNQKKSDLHELFCFFRDITIRILVNEKGMQYYVEKYQISPKVRKRKSNGNLSV